MKKKILIISPFFYPLLGGMEVQVMLLAKEYKRFGYDVDVLTERTKIEFAKEEKIDGIRVIRISHVGSRNIIGFIKLACDLMFFLIKNRNYYELIINRTFTFHALILGFLKWIKVIRTTTIVTAENGGEDDGVITLRERPFYKVILFLFGQNDYLNSICEDNYRHLRQLGFGEKKLTKIYNGVDFSQFETFDYPLKIRKFSYLGRLVPGKGLDELLEAFSKLEGDVELNIAGEGFEKEKIENYIRAHKKLKISYWGYVEKTKKEEFLKETDCLVLPSYSEGFPVSVIEAMARKKIVICSDVGDIRKLFENNVYICKKQDSRDLWRVMKNVLNNYRYGKIDYSDYSQEFSIERVAKQFLSLRLL